MLVELYQRSPQNTRRKEQTGQPLGHTPVPHRHGHRLNLHSQRALPHRQFNLSFGEHLRSGDCLCIPTDAAKLYSRLSAGHVPTHTVPKRIDYKLVLDGLRDTGLDVIDMCHAGGALRTLPTSSARVAADVMLRGPSLLISTAFRGSRNYSTCFHVAALLCAHA
jgi:hypothetical protein